MQAAHIEGKPWAVFVHGGEFNWGSNIDQGYAILAAKVIIITIIQCDYQTASTLIITDLNAVLVAVFMM